MTRIRLTCAVALVAMGSIGSALLVDQAWAAVGRTESAYGVTPNGDVAYSIPIRVTDGIAGLTPQLAINYAGPEWRSIFGVGFELAGLSYISPCPRTIAQDLTAAPVTLTSADRYCLDGARLRSVTGTYGATGATYRTELDQMARITSMASTNGVPGWFKVETRDGLIFEYGNTTDSKLLSSGLSGATPQFWAVNKISDRAENSISFVYDKNDGLRRFRPNYILYTASAAGAAWYKISFVYQTTIQSEPTLVFTPSDAGGAAHSDDKLLDRIELLHDSAIYRKYLFTFEAGAGANKRLKTIQECVPGTPDDCLPATTLGWQSATAGHASAVASSAVAFGVNPLDINGDGFEDVVWASDGTWLYMLGGTAGYGATINTGVAATNSHKAKPLEWNGDGYWDLLIDWSDGKWRVLTGSASGFSTSPVQAGPGAGIPSNLANNEWTIADADSDGRDDLLRMELGSPNPLTILLRLNGATGFGSETVAYVDDFLRAQTPGFVTLGIAASSTRRPDFNGDGRTDLLIFACQWDYDLSECIWTGWHQFISNGTTYWNSGNLPNSAYMTDPRYGDFNNDGLSDVAYQSQTPYPSKWYLGFGQGGGGLSIAVGPSYTGYPPYAYVTADYDGDGYDDLYLPHSSSATWHVFRGIGTGLATTPIATGISNTGFNWTPTDHNGDGLEDLGRYVTPSNMWSTFAHNGLPGERLISVTDGLSNVVAFTYLPMTNSTVYTKGTSAVFPNRDYQSAMPLVSSMQVSPAGGTSFSLAYKYAGARVHAQGRAFLGMESKTTTDSRSGVFTTEAFLQDFPYIGALADVTVKQTDLPLAKTIQKVTHNFANHLLDATAGNQRYLPYRSQTTSRNHEVGGIKNGNLITEVTEGHTVNTLGNSTFISVAVDDEDSGSSEFGSSWRTEVTTAYSEDQPNWCLAIPTSRSEKRILPGGTFEIRAASWTFVGLQCRVTQETVEPGAGSTLSLITDVGYDNCGNIGSISSYPSTLPAQFRSTTINYGSRCQRPETITNAENHVSTIAYNFSLALPSTQTDPNGISLNREYDGFGRLTRQVRPDGTAARFALTACTAGDGWCGKNSSARVKVSRTERNTLNSILRTDEQFLDGYGRVRWSHSDSLESGPSIIETLYDAFGRPTQQTQPYFTGSPVYSTSYLRDLVGRVTQVNAPIDEVNTSGRITGFGFEGRDLKITDPRNFVTTRRSNAIGQLRSVVDPSPGGTTNYLYHPFGDLASITDAAGNVTNWNFNVRGFLTSTNDPDSGNLVLASNAFGELTSQTDAKGQNVTFTFDKLSRPLTRNDPEGATNFVWGNSAAAKNIGQLASITSPGGYAEAFSFDAQGRLIQQTVTADATTYYIDLTYHLQTGLLETLQYPTSTSGYRLKLGYDYSSNLLQKVRDYNGSTIFWQATSTDAYGHTQYETFGNGVQTFTDFDQASGLMMAREGGIGGGTGLINSQVAWDLNGNLTQRKDLKLIPSITEDFIYDSLNRFDESKRTVGTGVPATNADVTLDTIGNITWKLGVGTYAYHATKKRAVIAAGSNSYGYDANGNMTSRNGSSIGYTSYNLPNVINAPGGYSSTLSYGAFRNRFKQVAIGASGTETTIYVAGLLEKVTRGSLVEWRHQIHGGNGAAAIHTRRTGGSPAADTVYVHSDHLGSPELLTSDLGAVLVRLSFAAYGERRDGADWDGPPPGGDLTTIGNKTRHGFTGHEHLDSVGLIHMNGRVYEPVAGRFLGRDPFIDGIASSQGANGYAYVHNNPLTLIDPSGYTHSNSNDVTERWYDATGNTTCYCAGPLRFRTGPSGVVDVDEFRFNPISLGGDGPWPAPHGTVESAIDQSKVIDGVDSANNPTERNLMAWTAILAPRVPIAVEPVVRPTVIAPPRPTVVSPPRPTTPIQQAVRRALRPTPQEYIRQIENSYRNTRPETRQPTPIPKPPTAPGDSPLGQGNKLLQWIREILDPLGLDSVTAPTPLPLCTPDLEVQPCIV